MKIVKHSISPQLRHVKNNFTIFVNFLIFNVICWCDFCKPHFGVTTGSGVADQSSRRNFSYLRNSLSHTTVHETKKDDWNGLSPAVFNVTMSSTGTLTVWRSCLSRLSATTATWARALSIFWWSQSTSSASATTPWTSQSGSFSPKRAKFKV